MKKLAATLLLLAMLLSLASCNKGSTDNRTSSDVDTLVSEYGFQ